MGRELLFERDPDLLGGAAGPEAAGLGRYVVETREPPVGPWEAVYEEKDRGVFALLLLEGILLRRVSVGKRGSVELLGPGDVLRPWVEDAEAAVAGKVEWSVHQPAKIAILPHAFPRDVAVSPRVMHVLADRMILRARWLAVDLAIGHATGVERRALFMLWHLADRWGRVTPDGIRLDLPLTHELLGDLIGARRPSVSTALGRLREGDVVRQLPAGGWLLRHPPKHADI